MELLDLLNPLASFDVQLLSLVKRYKIKGMKEVLPINYLERRLVDSSTRCLVIGKFIVGEKQIPCL